MKICQGNHASVTVGQKYRVFHLNNCIFCGYRRKNGSASLKRTSCCVHVATLLIFYIVDSDIHSATVKGKSKGLPQQAEVAQGVPGRLRPRIFLTFRHYKGGRSSAKRTGRLYPTRNPWYSLSEAESTPGHMVLSGEPREKFPIDTTGNRTRDRPTSSAVP